MNIRHDMSPKGTSPSDFIVAIEIPKGNKKRYELDKETGLTVLDRILYTSTYYLANYGFISRTYGDDCDLLDALVLYSEPLEPHTLVHCFPIGVVSMLDSGRNDERIIAIPFSGPTYNQYQDISELSTHTSDEMPHSFQVYKELESKETTVKGVSGREETVWIIGTTLDSYVENFCK